MIQASTILMCRSGISLIHPCPTPRTTRQSAFGINSVSIALDSNVVFGSFSPGHGRRPDYWGRFGNHVPDRSRRCLRGLGLELSAKNGNSSVHKPGGVFQIMTVLPNGKDLDLTAKVTYVSKDIVPGKLFMGMSFTYTPDWVKERLGFFLMT